ncbi:hypothetical protein BUE67_14015, partial [Corynebacterium diphtheriae]
IIDILAIIATVMGIATSIGLGIMQISGGLNHVFHVPNNNITKISITVLMMIIFIGSGITGLGRGVKWLSNLNIILGALLLVFMLIFGDLKFIFESYIIDILAIIATVMGIATSIGLGIMQISGGLNHV